MSIKNYKNNFSGIIIFGVDRSGTTLVYSILSNSSRFYWFSKLDTKIFRYPKLSLFARSFLGLFSKNATIAIPGKISKSTGFVSPSECVPYWKNIFKWGDESNYVVEDDFFDEKYLNHINSDAIRADFINRLTIFKKQYLLIKQPGFSHKLLFLSKLFPKFKFIHISRNPIDNIFSLVNAKKKSKELFWGTKIKGWKNLINEDYFTQSVHQVFETNNLIHKQINNNDFLKQRYFKIKYESIIKNPNKEIKKILSLSGLKMNNHIINSIKGVVNLKNNNNLPIDISDNNKKLIFKANELHQLDYK